MRFRYKPIDLQMLNTIIPRLPAEKYKSIKPQLKAYAIRLQKGYAGEKKLDYHLNQLPNDYTIIPDVTLRWNNKPFQIDTIVITPFNIHIISVKSIEGTITFDLNNRVLVQENRGVKQHYECPITQAERHKNYLMKWLDKQNLGAQPIYYWIAISEISTAINIQPEINKKPYYIDYVENIPGKIKNFEKENNHFLHKNITLKREITHVIMNESEDFQTDILDKYGIDIADIQNGVVCRECYQLNTTYHYGKFICSQCGQLPIDHVKQSLYELMQLHKKTRVKNEEIRSWICLENRHQTLRVIEKIGLKKQPHLRTWHLPPPKKQVNQHNFTKVE